MSDGYLGNDNLKRIGVELQYTEEQVKEILKCSEDPLYFVKNYVKIVNVDHGLVPFDYVAFPRGYGHDISQQSFLNL
jgi:hypothetical protein